MSNPKLDVGDVMVTKLLGTGDVTLEVLSKDGEDIYTIRLIKLEIDDEEGIDTDTLGGSIANDEQDPFAAYDTAVEELLNGR